MKEFIGDLRTLESTENPDGDALSDHGIVQQFENAMLDMAGKIVRIRITEFRAFRSKGRGE